MSENKVAVNYLYSLKGNFLRKYAKLKWLTLPKTQGKIICYCFKSILLPLFQNIRKAQEIKRIYPLHENSV